MPRKRWVVLAAFVLLFVAVVQWQRSRPRPVTASLSVRFIGMTNNPVAVMMPVRISVSQGATGECAMFWVQNVSSNRWIWFKTAAIEQKTETGWHSLTPSGALWGGIEGRIWSPGYGCLYAIGWPPGLSSNATWRLRLSYGPEPSTLGIILNQKMGREMFRSGREEAVIWSTEVTQ